MTSAFQSTHSIHGRNGLPTDDTSDAPSFDNGFQTDSVWPSEASPISLNAVPEILPQSAATTSGAASAASSAGGNLTAMMNGGPLSKLDTSLAALYLGGVPAAHTSSVASDVSASTKLVTDAEGAPAVVIDALAKDGDGAALLAELQAAGLENGASFGADAGGVLPVADIGAVLGLTNLSFAHASVARVAASTNPGPIPAEASQALNATQIATNYGVDGTGVTVGVISDSFNTSTSKDPLGNADTMATDIANGYLPTNTTDVADLANGTDEGRAMAQIIHEIAPGASILFETGDNSEASFAANIIDLASKGAKVIVDDLGYGDEPYYQDGIIAQAISTVEAQGVVYLVADGNDGSNGYEGAFTPGATFTYSGKTETADNFSSGNSLIPITVKANSSAYFILEWSQPAASADKGVAGATSDLDLFLTDANGNVVNSLAATDNNIGGDPIEFLSVNFGSAKTEYLRIGLAAGSVAPTDIKLIASDDDGGTAVTLGTEASSTDNGTVYGHSSDGISVGAAYFGQTPALGQTPPLSEFFSSSGPDNVYYDTNGNLLPAIRANAVTVTGVDGEDTSFFGNNPTGLGYPSDGDNFNNFFGTSAAAPSLAAVAALMLQANPNLSPSDDSHILVDSAIVMADPSISGAGLAQADKAVSYAKSEIITAFAGGNTALYGTHLSDTFVLNPGVTTTLSGDGGADTFQTTLAGFNGTTITDMQAGDKIHVTNASLSTFVDQLSGATFRFGTNALNSFMTFSGSPFGYFTRSVDPNGGIDLTFKNGEQTRDFSDDGLSDIAFQNTDSSVAIWDMSSSSILTLGSSTEAASLATPGAPWKLIGSGDFYHDGTADLLLQNTQSGALAFWGIRQGASGPILDNSETLQLASVLNPGPTWHAIATGDFNGDGHADIAFQSDDSSVAVWEMNGASLVNNGAAVLALPGTNWHLRSTGDFYGDGTSDLLLQRDDGLLAIWGIKQGASGPIFDPNELVQFPTSLNTGADWVVKGSGDFNADGKSDIVFQNSQTGDVVIWEMNGANLLSPTSAAVIASPGTTLSVKSVGDYNGDGMSDILLQNSQTGALSMWFMNGLSQLPASTQLAANPGTSWTPVG